MHTQWYYKDMSGVIQGPYTTDQMLQWNQAGYFPISTLVSGGNNFGPWKALKDIKQLYEQNSVTSMKFSPTSDVSSSVQDRIAALRNSRDMHNDDEDGIVDDVDVSLQMRIAALKAAPLHSVATPDPHTSGKSYDSCNRATSTVGSEHDQNKAVATTTDRCDIKMNEKANVDSRITSESGDYNALLPSLPPPASKNEAMVRENLLLYPVDDDDNVSYPIGDYTSNVENADDTFENHYQLEYGAADNEAHIHDEDDIPVTGDYSENSLNENSDYPVTSFYDNGDSRSDSADVDQPKKRIKVDDAVVALVPSCIRKR